MHWKRYKKITISLLAAFFVLLAVLFFAARNMGQTVYTPEFGISFDPEYALSMSLDWQEVYMHMLQDLQPEYVRIAAKWNTIQPENRDGFDYRSIDWMMNRAYEHNAKVVLAMGQKSPRWPECYVPSWVSEDGIVYEYDLLRYVQTTVERYYTHPALFMWQVENEPFIVFDFGECARFEKDMVEKEVSRVRMYDVVHPILITDSGELGFWRKASRVGDVFGTTLYRVVRKPGGKIFTYDWLAPGWYNLKAKLLGIQPKDMIVSELQAEPWFFEETPLLASVPRMEETMTPERMIQHVDFAQHLHVAQVYLWGVEWWYYMMEERGDDRYWGAVKEFLADT